VDQRSQPRYSDRRAAATNVTDVVGERGRRSEVNCFFCSPLSMKGGRNQRRIADSLSKGPLSAFELGVQATVGRESKRPARVQDRVASEPLIKAPSYVVSEWTKKSPSIDVSERLGRARS
jgi:hypothetical protein